MSELERFKKYDLRTFAAARGYALDRRESSFTPLSCVTRTETRL